MVSNFFYSWARVSAYFILGIALISATSANAVIITTQPEHFFTPAIGATGKTNGDACSAHATAACNSGNYCCECIQADDYFLSGSTAYTVKYSYKEACGYLDFRTYSYNSTYTYMCPDATWIYNVETELCEKEFVEDPCITAQAGGAKLSGTLILPGDFPMEQIVIDNVGGANCEMKLTASQPSGYPVLSELDWGDGTMSFVQVGEYEYTGTRMDDNAVDIAVVGDDLDAVTVEPLVETPVYTEDFKEVSRVVEELPDGSTFEQVVTIDTRTKEASVEYQQLTGTEEWGWATYQQDSVLQVTETTTTTTAPDGSRIENIETTTDYKKLPGVTVENSFDGTTITQSGGGTSSTTKNVTNKYNPDGSLAESSSSVTGTGGAAETGVVTEDPLQEEAEDEDVPGPLTMPENGSTGEESYELQSFTTKIRDVPIVAAVGDVFNVSLGGGSCPVFGFSAPFIGAVSTNIHCQIMADFNAQLYALMIGLWVLAGAMIILRA